MSQNFRNGLTIFMLVILAISAFVAGYFARDLINSQDEAAHAEENLGVFWEAWSRINSHFIGELPSDQTRTYGAIRGSLQTINDPYTVFVEPVAREHEKEQLQGTFGGIGAYVSRPEDGGEILLEPIPGNPAEEAGILTGDTLIKVDGVPITVEMTVADVADLIRGEKGSSVILTIRHKDETETVEISVTRGDILIPSVTYNLLDEDERIGYIRLTRFSGESGGEVAEAIVELQRNGADRLILDLRQNRGGLLDAAIEVSDHFLGNGIVLHQQSQDQGEKTFRSTSETLATDEPLVVLVDSGSASASEIVAGALQDRERGTLIGHEPTFGKGSVQLVFDLSDGSSIHVTSARWFTPDHNQLDGQGLEPNIKVEVTQGDIDNGRDAVLNRAILFLQEGS